VKSIVHTPRENLIRHLCSFGEDEIAARICLLPESDYIRIQERAFEYAFTSEVPSGRGMLLAKALSKAAVDIIEGSPRELKRKKRKTLP
jgi:hypothetical protein